MYDGSGEFAVRVGIPSKSGVGGGLLSVVDGKMGIGIYGPSLDAKGNSIARRKILQFLSSQMRIKAYFCEEGLSSFLMKGNSSSGYDESMKVVREPRGKREGRRKLSSSRKN